LTAALEGLVATTVALADLPDIVTAAGSDGYLFRGENGGLVAHGVAVRVDLRGGLSDAEAVRHVEDVLARISVVDEVGLPGCGPVAIGALPFDPCASGHLVIPRRIVGRSGDKAWVTTIEPSGRAGGSADTGGSGNTHAAEPPDRFTLSSAMSHAEWRDVVSEAVDAIRRGDLSKVVLARRIDIEANRRFIVSDVLERLTALYPSCMIFSIDGFVGASPELLVSRFGDTVSSHPLAGTVARSGNVHGDEALVAKLMASPKARHEHKVVVDALAAALRGYCTSLDVPETPTVVGLRNVSHLGTRITGQLAHDQHDSDSRLPSALELVAAVHPTPAVGGTPTDAAVRYLQKVEGFDRHCYAGPVGWLDRNGDGEWAIGIRCAEIDGTNASIFAGNGIVAASEPSDELAETQLKLQALLAALVRP
jgi:menaquinone-specific isochorismate synthase